MEMGSFFELPNGRGIKVDDTVTFSLPEPYHIAKGSDSVDLPGADGWTVAEADNRTGAGVLLTSKTIHALERMGYTDDDVKNVCKLVARNLMTVQSSQILGKAREEAGLDKSPDSLDVSGVDEGDTRQMVKLMLSGILQQDLPKSRSVHFNSNEPVLLVGIGGLDGPETNQDVLNRIVDEVLHQLHGDWNLWPVRVYAGALVSSPKGVLPRHAGFDISLLNVVNTDIGGPSMVQLLDEHCEAPEWNRWLRREVWRGRDFVSREDGGWGWSEARRDASPSGSERSAESVRDELVDSLELVIEETPRQEPLVGASKEQVGDSTVGKGEAPEDEDKLTASLQGSSPKPKPEAMEEQAPQEPSLPERSINYPTWERLGDGMSLLDLIRSQALSMAPFGQDEAAVNADEQEDPEALHPVTDSDSGGESGEEGEYVHV